MPQLSPKLTHMKALYEVLNWSIYKITFVYIDFCRTGYAPQSCGRDMFLGTQELWKYIIIVKVILLVLAGDEVMEAI